MMFRHMGWNDVADLIVYAVSAVIRSGIVTYDLARLMSGAREVSCSGFAKAVIERMNSEQVA
jgi:isocitrate dehydrogenase